MSDPILFIADLHLDPSRPAVTETFLRFLEEEATDAGALYILGDLFEAWVGDDAVSGDEPEIEAMAELSQAGTPLFIMHGNRDFLLGEAFAEMTGATLLPDPSVTRVHGERVLITHGDSLCLGDPEYVAFRAMVRDPEWQRRFLSLPLDERIRQARHARAQSMARTGTLDPEIMDVAPAAVHQAMRDHGVQWLIHGHTHRPAVHRLQLGEKEGARFVLGDWFEQGSVLRCLPDTWTLERWDHPVTLARSPQSGSVEPGPTQPR